MEISPDGASLRPRSRFARFTNLPELQLMFRAFADVQTAAMLDLPRPRLETGKAIVIACPMSDEQATLQGELVARYDRLRTQKVDPPRRQCPGHHDRRPKARPRRPDAVGVQPLGVRPI
jgi:N12 class adenine-specific DNA methylase